MRVLNSENAFATITAGGLFMLLLFGLGMLVVVRGLLANREPVREAFDSAATELGDLFREHLLGGVSVAALQRRVVREVMSHVTYTLKTAYVRGNVVVGVGEEIWPTINGIRPEIEQEVMAELQRTLEERSRRDRLPHRLHGPLRVRFVLDPQVGMDQIRVLLDGSAPTVEKAVRASSTRVLDRSASASRTLIAPGGETFAVSGTETIGTGAGCSIRLADDTVSHEHARVWTVQDGLAARDLGSTNGTIVDGERLEPYCDVTIGIGSRLTLGETVFEVA